MSDSFHSSLKKFKEGLKELKDLMPLTFPDGADEEEIERLTEDFINKKNQVQKNIDAAWVSIKRSGKKISMQGYGFTNNIKQREITTVPNESGFTICCPKCYDIDRQNRTTPLNRKQMRNKPEIKGFPIHRTAYCFN